MAKLMAFRFEPTMDLIIQEIALDFTKREVRHVSKTEVMERAVATLYSLLISGNINILSSNPQIESAYTGCLAEIRGLTIKEDEKEAKQ